MKQGCGVLSSLKGHATHNTPGIRDRIIELCTGQNPTYVLPPNYQNAPIQQESRSVILARGGQVSGRTPYAGDWIIYLCAA